MRKASGFAAVVATILLSVAPAVAGPWEDGMVAYNRGDYMPAVNLFRPLAQAGNAKAQNVLGLMYRKGEGMTRSPARAFMWFSIAARKGDAAAKANLQEMAREMTPADMTHASDMMAACEASDYRNCEY